MRAGVLIALLGALAIGCGSGNQVPPPKNQLEGSLSVVMDLGWDVAFIDTTTDEIAVRFVRKRGQTEDTTLKVTWAQAGQTLNTPSTIDLAEPRPDNPNVQRAIISRNVLDDPRTVFPLLVRGKMTFFDQIKPDTKVRGQFNATFEDGIDFANGRTVFGPFLAQVPP